MKWIFAAFALLFLIPSDAGAWSRGGITMGTNYYISPTGSDANNGTSAATAWLTPNHSVSCGDVIHAAAGTYTNTNFRNAKWGAVSNCPSASGVNFAIVLCDGPFVTSCNTTAASGEAFRIDKSNWAVSGWTASSGDQACFSATPSSAANIHHIAFINVVCTGAFQNGVTSYPYTGGDPSKGVDYFAIVGGIAYNAAQGGSLCFSGFSVYEPVKFDSAAGTHIYTAGLFGISNKDPDSGCPGNSDGEGIIYDDWGHAQQAGVAYDQQGVIEQSLFIGNGSAAVELFSSTSAPMFVQNVTGWGNYTSAVHAGTYNGEGLLSSAQQTTWTNNIFQANIQTQNGNAVYGFLVGTGVFQSNATNTVSGNVIFGVGGNNTSNQGTGFSYGSNTLATPNFVAPAVPGSAPNCTGFATTTACMATVAANFVAQAGAASGKGYQSPGACAPNALYPVWLKGIVPNGLINKPCGL